MGTSEVMQSAQLPKKKSELLGRRSVPNLATDSISRLRRANVNLRKVAVALCCCGERAEEVQPDNGPLADLIRDIESESVDVDQLAEAILKAFLGE